MHRDVASILICPFSRGQLRLEVFESSGDRVGWGVLSGDGVEFPIIAGVPLFQLGVKGLVEKVRQGHRAAAAAQACFESAPPDLLGHAVEILKSSGRVGARAGGRLKEWRYQRFLDSVSAELFTSDGEPNTNAKALFELAYKKARKPAANDTYHYFYARFGLPTHFVGLAYIDGMTRTSGYIMDHCCGAGHLTRHIAQRHGRPERIVGYDQGFFSLYVASVSISPEANFVCGSPEAAPFADGSFTSVFNLDAFLNISRKWTSLSVINRILSPDGEMLLVWLKNSKRHHLYPGKPLPASAYRQLVADLPHRMIPDSITLQRFLNGDGVDASIQAPIEELEKESTFSIWAFKSDPVFRTCDRISAWPQAQGKLAVNPIYAPDKRVNGSVEYVLRFPSEFYRHEDKEAKFYYRERFTLSEAHRKALERNDPEPLGDLIRTGAILGFPPHYGV